MILEHLDITVDDNKAISFEKVELKQQRTLDIALEWACYIDEQILNVTNASLQIKS